MTNESGRSLIEMLGVISLIAVITVSSMGVVNFIQTRYRVATIQSEVEEIVRGVFDLFSFHRTLKNIPDIQKTICENDILPRDCFGNKWENEFGGNIEVTFTEGEKIQITYTNLPDKISRLLMCRTEWASVIPEAPDMDTGCRCGKSLCSFGATMIFTSK